MPQAPQEQGGESVLGDTQSRTNAPGERRSADCQTTTVGLEAPAQRWVGLNVSTQDGAHLGQVMGWFEQGPCAGRLRVHGDAAQFPRRGETGTAVFAIPARAVTRRAADALLLDTTANAARHRWFMHVIERTGD